MPHQSEMTPLWNKLIAQTPSHECCNHACGRTFASDSAEVAYVTAFCPTCERPSDRIAESTRVNMALFQWLGQQQEIPKHCSTQLRHFD